MGQVTEIQIPPTARAKQVPVETVEAMLPIVLAGKAATDGESYPTKGRAAGAAARIKRALANADGLDYGELRSRVLPGDKRGTFVLAVTLKQAAVRERARNS